MSPEVRNICLEKGTSNIKGCVSGPVDLGRQLMSIKLVNGVDHCGARYTMAMFCLERGRVIKSCQMYSLSL